MEQHPIADLRSPRLHQEMIDVNTICGEAIVVNDDCHSVSKVNCVFATGAAAE